MAHRTLRIPPAPEAWAIASPQEVFAHLLPDAEGLKWVLWGETEMTAQPDAGLDVLGLEQRVESSPRGVVMDWPALSDILGKVTQVIDGTFIGCRDPDVVPPFPDTPIDDVHRGQEFLVVTAFDSSWWWISGASLITERVEIAFPHAERGFG